MSEESKRKIGVFICHCGGNISDYVDVKKVAQEVAGEDGVVVSKNHMFTCSDAAQQEMIKDIQDEKLDGLVIASCSPKLHMYTFRGMAERAGLNPYQYIQVNLREQCSWAHRDDKVAATEKGIDLVRGGIAKCRYSQALAPIVVKTTSKALVIGGGITGLRSAISLSDMNITVYLLEKANELGGWTKRWDSLFPNNHNGKEMIADLIKEVNSRDNIISYTSSELVQKSGTIGNFDVKIRVGSAENISLNVGAIIVATGFHTYTPYENEYGYGLSKVMTLPQYKQLLQQSNGQLVFDNKPVKKVAMIYCVGSRQSKCEATPNPNKYCSRFCCNAAIHTAYQAHEKYPHMTHYHLYRDIRAYGKNELLYEESRSKGSIYLRFDESKPPTVEEINGRTIVKVTDQLTNNEALEIDADLVVLVTGMVPRENKALNDILKLPVDSDGFFKEIHLKLRPVETVIDGVFIAGACQSPKDLQESVSSGLAAVSKTGALLMKGQVKLEPLVAEVDRGKCGLCEECFNACPYTAISTTFCEGKEVAEIIPSLCKGCGGCVPRCPKDAISVLGYTNDQIMGMIDAFGRNFSRKGEAVHV